MEKKICGTCAKLSDMSKEERIKIALSRVENEFYFCPVCKESHSFRYKRVDINESVEKQLQLF